jgi:cellulose biosynthesis protein BcsQ
MHKINWQTYLKRKNPIFYVAVCNKTYGAMLRDATGFRFTNQLYAHKDGMSTLYKSKTELEKANAYFLDLIKNDKEKIYSFHKKGMGHLEKEKELLQTFSKDLDIKFILQNYDNIMEDCHNIFLYLTTIPLLISHSLLQMNSASFLKTEQFQNK